MTTYVADEPLTPLGYEQITGAVAATGLTPPPGARYALIQALTQAARWRDDGTDPTATVGMQIAAGDSLFYNGEIGHIRLIEEAASTEINVTYYA